MIVSLALKILNQLSSSQKPRVDRESNSMSLRSSRKTKHTTILDRYLKNEQITARLYHEMSRWLCVNWMARVS